MIFNSIEAFSKNPSRNHIIFSKNEFPEFEYIDVGKELSKRIENELTHRHLSLRSQDYLSSIIKEGIICNDRIGDYIALKNIGILFEPRLQIDPEAVFNRWSQNQTLIIKMENGMIEDYVYYLHDRSTPNFSINLNNFNFIEIK